MSIKPVVNDLNGLLTINPDASYDTKDDTVRLYYARLVSLTKINNAYKKKTGKRVLEAVEEILPHVTDELLGIIFAEETLPLGLVADAIYFYPQGLFKMEFAYHEDTSADFRKGVILVTMADRVINAFIQSAPLDQVQRLLET